VTDDYTLKLIELLEGSLSNSARMGSCECERELNELKEKVGEIAARLMTMDDRLRRFVENWELLSTTTPAPLAPTSDEFDVNTDYVETNPYTNLPRKIMI
jgi:hypothetical protein